MKRSDKRYEEIVFWIFAIVVIIGSIGHGIAFYASAENNDITVDEKWTKYKDGSEQYLFSDVNDNVYEIDDSVRFLTFDSSDRYALIESGKTYDMKLIGWRIPYLSMYPNAIEINKV